VKKLSCKLNIHDWIGSMGIPTYCINCGKEFLPGMKKAWSESTGCTHMHKGNEVYPVIMINGLWTRTTEKEYERRKCAVKEIYFRDRNIFSPTQWWIRFCVKFFSWYYYQSSQQVRGKVIRFFETIKYKWRYAINPNVRSRIDTSRITKLRIGKLLKKEEECLKKRSPRKTS